MQIEIHLADREDAFRDGALNDAAAMTRAKNVKVTIDADAPATDDAALALCERIFALANGFPNPADYDASYGYYANQVRSLSVGDAVTIPGSGTFNVMGVGFEKAAATTPAPWEYGCGALTRGGGGARCKLEAGHSGPHASITFGCDGCGGTFRGQPHATAPDGEYPSGLHFCFLCARGLR